MLGVATADGLHALPAVLGGSALAGLLRPALTPLRRAAALVPAAPAAHGAATALRRYRGHGGPPLPSRPPPPRPARTPGCSGVTLLDPATVVHLAALVLGTRTARGVRPLEQAVFVPAAFAASASRRLLLAGSGALLGRALTGRRGRLATALVSSGVITAPAVRTTVSP